MDPTERFAHIVRLEANDRIGVTVGTRLRLSLQLIERTGRRNLGQRRGLAEQGPEGGCREETGREIFPHGDPLYTLVFHRYPGNS